MSVRSPDSGLRVRVATPADAGLLARTAERMFRDAFAPSNDAAQMDAYCAEHYGEAIQRAELEQPEIRVLLVEEDDGVIAYAQLRVSAPVSEVWRFYVDRAQHGRGIAQQLMAASLDALRAAGATRVSLAVWEHNPRAIAFYRKCGFEVTRQQPFVLGTEVQTDLVMERPLRDA
jgi:ribosomal protein S18 acetylase RimI-like enzyme